MSSLRSFGGGELRGDKLVRMIYMDEAGISNNGVENVVVMAGCILHMDSQWTPLRERFGELADKYVPAEHRDRFVFHAKDIWHGSGIVFNRDTYEGDRRQVLLDLCRAIAEFEIGIVYGVSKKDVVAQLISDDGPVPAKVVAQVCYMAALADATAYANKWIERYAANEVTSVVIEDSPEFRRYGKLAFKAMRGDEMAKVIEEIVPGLNRLHHIIDAPSYMEKADAPALQLADVCAFLLRRWFEGKQDVVEPLSIIFPQILSSRLSDEQLRSLAAEIKAKEQTGQPHP